MLPSCLDASIDRKSENNKIIEKSLFDVRIRSLIFRALEASVGIQAFQRLLERISVRDEASTHESYGK